MLRPASFAASRQAATARSSSAPRGLRVRSVYPQPTNAMPFSVIGTLWTTVQDDGLDHPATPRRQIWGKRDRGVPEAGRYGVPLAVLRPREHQCSPPVAATF